MASSLLSTTFLVAVLLVALICLSNDVDARPKSNVVHRVPMTRRPSSHGTWPKAIAERIKQARGGMQLKASIAGSLPATIDDYEMIAQLEVGTPSQKIPVYVALEYLDEFWVLGADASYESRDPKVLYNEVASSTFKNGSADYTGGWGYVKGYLASDVVNLAGSLQPTLQFGVAEDAGWLLAYMPGSGILGLSTNKTSSLSPLHQILDQADQKVYTFWNSALDAVGNGTGLLTFGAEDSQNCPSAYVHANQIKGFSFSAQSLSYGELSVGLNNASIFKWAGIGLATTKKEVVDFFIKATGATVYSEDSWPKIDCDKVNALPAINLNLGNDQFVALNPVDYTFTSSEDHCYITILKYTNVDIDADLLLGPMFPENRCISVNLDSKQIGFSSS